jgi:heme/copper-type cytochrome/quinol oxidase subunit 1
MNKPTTCRRCKDTKCLNQSIGFDGVVLAISMYPNLVDMFMAYRKDDNLTSNSRTTTTATSNTSRKKNNNNVCEACFMRCKEAIRKAVELYPQILVDSQSGGVEKKVVASNEECNDDILVR